MPMEAMDLLVFATELSGLAEPSVLKGSLGLLFLLLLHEKGAIGCTSLVMY